ncbi:MAG TPA: Gfo/Idh/MocA family oxidoreductase [Pirellulales bacterium]|nr:Gfo/Idh/MocA family oxidoreductase [Pirellulales bacterium]
MNSINFIGLGHWGPNLVRAFINSQRATVGLVCDLSPSRLATIQRNISTSIRTTSDPLVAANDPAADAVVIATPTNTHFALAKAALEAGKHVLVEKPLAGSVEDAEALVKLAKQRNRLLAVGHVFLFNNGIRAVKNLIAHGDLGNIRYIFSTRTNLGPFRTDVNALWDLGAHDVSIFNYWLDAEPRLATAYGTSYLTPGVEDVVVANFSYPRQVQACVHASWLNPQKVREITVVGERQMVVWNDMDLNEPVRIYHKSVDVERPASDRDPGYVDSFGAFRMLVRSGDVVIPKIDAGQPLDAECQHFLDCLEGKATPINDGAVGLQAVRALAAAQQSMRNCSALTEIAGPVRRAAAA